MEMGKVFADASRVFDRRAIVPSPAVADPKATPEADQLQTPFWKKVAGPILKLVMGNDWASYITRSPLPENLKDQGPAWLTAITRRLDGSQNEGVSLTLNADVAIPTPLPGLTLGARGSGQAMLRRTPQNRLQLAYAREIDPAASAGLNFGGGFGFGIGRFHFDEGISAHAGAEGQLVHRATFLFDLNPQDSQDMQALAHFLGVHALAETMRVGHMENPSLLDELHRVIGDPLAAPTKPGSPIPVNDTFTRAHLQQLSLYEGVRGNLDAGLNNNLSGSSRDGLWGWARGPAGLDLGNPSTGTPKGLGPNVVGTLLNLVTSAASTSVDVNQKFEKGIEQLITFDHGQPLQATESASTSKMGNKGWGVMGYSRWHFQGDGTRYAATYKDGKLVGVDYSRKSAVDNNHRLTDGLTPTDQVTSDVLKAAKSGDTVVMTFSLPPDRVAAIAALPQADQPKAIEALKQDSSAFQLTRVMTAHNSLFSLGGDWNFGFGNFGALGGGVDGLDQKVQTQVMGNGPSDPLPNGQPW